MNRAARLRRPDRTLARRRARPAAAAALAALAAFAIGGNVLAPVRVDAATKTTKSKAAQASAGTASTVPKPTTTTTLPPRRAGEPLKGFAVIGPEEWPSPGDAVVAAAVGRSIEVLRAPDDRTGALRFDEGKSVSGPLRFLAVGSFGPWVRVLLPVRPNGTIGWVKASEVRLSRTNYRITVELTTNTLRVLEGDSVTLETKVAAGTGGTPTPVGLFYVKELVPQANPNGALGPIALGLSGFSTVLQTFAGGSGTIAIHGTNAPNKLGGDVSHGCIRVANPVITKIASLVPLGTPVEIAQRFTDLPTARVTSAWTAQIGAPGQPAVVAAGATVAPGDATATAPVAAGTPTASVLTTAPPTTTSVTPDAASTTVA